MAGYVFNCSGCGRFATQGSWAHQYDFVAMEPSHDTELCQHCTDKNGPAMSNARPHNNVWDRYEGRIVDGEYVPGSLVFERSAQAMEARRAETGTGSVHDSAVHAPQTTPQDA
jgi:hypothetical protein